MELSKNNKIIYVKIPLKLTMLNWEFAKQESESRIQTNSKLQHQK